MIRAEARPVPPAETTHDPAHTDDIRTDSMQPRCMEQLAIVEKYERFIDYVYPLLRGVPRAGGNSSPPGWAMPAGLIATTCLDRSTSIQDLYDSHH